MSPTSLAQQVTGRHVLFILLGFFGVMIAVNAVFLYFALTTFNGLESPNAYERGLRYNEVLAAEKAQAALGWKHELTLDKDGALRLAVRDAEGSPVTRLAISGEVGRPVHRQNDISLTFEEIEPGIYLARNAAEATGAWIASIEAEKARPGEAPVTYRIKERLWLSPR